MNKYQEALDFIKNSYTVYGTEYFINKHTKSIEALQELIDKCVFINEEWKTKNNVQDTFLIETPTDRTCLPQGVDYEQ